MTKSDLSNEIIAAAENAGVYAFGHPEPDTYRGWTITQGRWPEAPWMATGPNYDAWTEGEGEWADNGQKRDGVTREHLIEEIDAWFDEHADEKPDDYYDQRRGEIA